MIRAAVAPWLGYTDHLKLMTKALLAYGKNVIIRPTSVCEHLKGDYHPIDPVLKSRFLTGPQPEEWEILLSPPSEKPTPGKRTLYFTMWESTKLKPEAVKNLNLAEVVCVPCDWNARCFRACGVTKPIRVCHLGMDPEIYKHHPMPKEGPFVFGAAGRLVHGETRKGIKEAIDCFLKAFPDDTDVRLKVKCFKDDPIGEMPDDPRISVEKRYLSDQGMAMWLATLNCFVALAKGEGWGAIQQQAMMVGRPVIGPIYSGTEMFMKPGFTYAVPYSLEKPPTGNFYEGLGYWAVPDDQMTIFWMRVVKGYARQIVEATGWSASLHASKFTNMESNGKLLKVIEEFGIL